MKKRLKEAARQERQRDKAEKREARKAEKVTAKRGPGEEDPDLAGIVPGPQPEADVDQDA